MERPGTVLGRVVPGGWTSIAFLNAALPGPPHQPPLKRSEKTPDPFLYLLVQGQGARSVFAFTAGRWLNDGNAEGSQGRVSVTPQKHACPVTGQPLAGLGCSQFLHWPHASDGAGSRVWAGQNGDTTNSVSVLVPMTGRPCGVLSGWGRHKGQCVAARPTHEGGTWSLERKRPGGRKGRT